VRQRTHARTKCEILIHECMCAFKTFESSGKCASALTRAQNVRYHPMNVCDLQHTSDARHTHACATLASVARTQAQARKNTRHINGRHLEGSEIVYVRFQNLTHTHIQVTSTSAHTNIQYANKYAHATRLHVRTPATPHMHTHIPHYVRSV